MTNLANSGPKILVVEDEDIVALDLERNLRMFGYDVVGVADSQRTALRLTAVSSPDVVLMDIRLRGNVDGISIAEDIQNQRGVAAIVFLTAHDDDETFRRAMGVRPYGFLTKPFRNSDLNTTVRLAFEQSRTPRGDTRGDFLEYLPSSPNLVAPRTQELNEKSKADRQALAENIRQSRQIIQAPMERTESLRQSIEGQRAKVQERCVKTEQAVQQTLPRVWESDPDPAVQNETEPDDISPAALLTTREIQVLKLTAEGKSRKESAFALGVSQKTVAFHRGNLAKKLSLYTTAALTRYALKRRLI